ncbi:MAG: hypothetical protein HC780_10185 [Leptolyngbyaceae cyanobacterium CSU_1_3]|nr:hypothetical protein [Leptolyngbyaceae cyanobacterium CSU_1_3]
MSSIASTQVKDEKDLEALLKNHLHEPTYYFLRQTHQVSGILQEFPEKLDVLEGQLFNAEFEVRWKCNPQQKGYSVLVLSRSSLKDSSLKPLPGQWESEDHSILLHDPKTPQYPNGFTYKEGVDVSRIYQRYFRNVDTFAVQFIALTVKDHESRQ